MKCFEAEKWILLKDSGELDAKRRKLLQAHLENCESCSEFEQMLKTVKPACEVYVEPPAEAVYNVLRNARNRRGKKSLRMLYWKPALALAASVLIVLGLFFSYLKPAREVVPVFTENDILDLDTQILTVMESGLSEDDMVFDFLMTYQGT